MLSLDKSGADRFLIQLEEKGLLDPGYRFYRENDGLRLLGAGGFSYVYEMYDAGTPDKRYAAKILGLTGTEMAPDLVDRTTQIQYLMAEQSQNIMRVIGKNTIRVLLNEDGSPEAKETDDSDDLTNTAVIQIVLMEKLDSIIEKDRYGNVVLLRDELKTENGIIRFAESIGRALFTIHNNEYLHRDIKLENIFWDSKLETYKLGDFGIAKYVGQKDAETMVFTDGYGAPEIERQLEMSYNTPADIYSFGITLFLLLNDLKFPASDGYRVNMVQYSNDFVVPAPEKASENLAQIVRKMCSFKVSERYQSIEEVLMDIGRIDGTYTDNGFIEYGDFATETYMESEEYSSETETFCESDDEDNILKEKESKNTRKERILSEREKRLGYVKSMFINSALMALVLYLLFEASSDKTEYIYNWKYWALAAALFTEAILQRFRSFHIDFGFFLLVYSAYIVYTDGPDVIFITAIMSVLMWSYWVTISCSLGLIIWGFRNVLFGFDIPNTAIAGWILLAAFIAMCFGTLNKEYVQGTILEKRFELKKKLYLVFWIAALLTNFFIRYM